MIWLKCRYELVNVVVLFTISTENFHIYCKYWVICLTIWGFRSILRVFADKTDADAWFWTNMQGTRSNLAHNTVKKYIPGSKVYFSQK